MFGYIYKTVNTANGMMYIGQHASSEFNPNYHGSGKEIGKALKEFGPTKFKTWIIAVCESEEELNLEEIRQIALHNAVEDKNFYNISYGGTSCSRGLKTMYNPETDDILMSCEEHMEFYESLGYYHGMRPHSEESKQRYKEAKKDKIPITDEKITVYIDKKDLPLFEAEGWRRGRDHATRPNQKEEHRKWMSRGDESYMVKPENFQYYIDRGFVFKRPKFKQFNRVAPPYNKGKKLINGKYV